MSDERDEALVIRDYERRLDEYRAEVRSLRILPADIEKTKKRTAVLVEYGQLADGRVAWIVTAPHPQVERVFADALAAHITEDLGKAFKLAEITFTGSSREAK